MPVLDRQQRIEEQSHAVILPNVVRFAVVEVQFPVEEIEEAIAQGQRLHILGDILYEDVFGKHRESKFCWFEGGTIRLPHMSMCTRPNHNTIE